MPSPLDNTQENLSQGKCNAITSWIRARSGSTHWPHIVALLAILLTLPSLTAGWLPDDYHHQIRLIGDGRLAELSGSSWDLFNFASGDIEQNRELMEIGVWPWWTLPDLRAAFWRPLSVITHWLDYQLWPGSPVAMHAHSILWYGLLVLLVSRMYRRMSATAWIAGLAALLYAIDDARAMPVGFIANRNAIISVCFGVGAIMMHDRWRRDGWRFGAVAAPMLLAASLFSAEAGIGTIAYLFAYAVFLDRANLRTRFAHLIPYALIVVGWRILWTHRGYGIYGMESYVDPLGTPIVFLGALLERAPVMLLGQLLLPPSQLHLLCVDQGVGIYYSIAATVLVVVLAVAIARRIAWDSTARFWALGMLLSLIPICATFAADRMLFFVGLGGFALIARYFADAFRMTDSHDKGSVTPPKKGVRRLAVLLFIVHLILAPIGLVFGSFFPVVAPSSLLDKFEGFTIPMGEEAQRQTIVLVTAPLPLAAGYLPERRELAGLPVPLHTRALAPAFPRPVLIHRTDERTLQIMPKYGFLNSSLDRLARGLRFPLKPGQQIKLSGMTAHVLGLLEDGRPSQVEFRFDTPLEDESLRFFYWKGGFFSGDFAPFVPPPIGETIRLE